MSTIDEIKARIDIVDLVSETVQLRHSGKNYTGFCPFHSNTRTPAFAVFPESGTWRCFGQCNEGGDIFGFVMKKEGWDFSEALQFLADKAGVPLTTPSPMEQEAAEEHAALRALLEDAATFFRHQLTNTKEGNQALEYLHKRMVSDQSIEAFALGYAPHAWDTTYAYMRSRGASDKDLLDAGLVTERETGGVYDRFRHRIMFPIRDERGRITGFGARILNPEDTPKFLNSPQTPVFDKGRLLYGLDRARKDIRLKEQAVIVEGYLDVIALHQAGFTNAVSPMGTALTEHQLFLLKRISQRIVLALDPDSAGAKATLRGLELARQTLDRADEVIFDARGLLHHEARLQADIRVTTLPEGMDPDDVVHRDPAEWEHLVADAKPVVIHVMETLAASRDLNDPKVKEEIATQVLPLIEDVPSAIERDTYRQRLARLLRVDESTLIGESFSRPGRRRSPSRRQPTAVPSPAVSTPRLSSTILEDHVLGGLLRQPSLLYMIDRELQKQGLARFTPADFQNADHQAIMKLLQESIDQDAAEPLKYVMIHLSLPLMETADSLLEHTHEIDPIEERMLSDLIRGILDLRHRTLRQNIEYIRFQMEAVQENGDLRATQYQESMVQHTQALRRIDRALSLYTTHLMPDRSSG